MAGLCEGGNEPPGSLKAIKDHPERLPQWPITVQQKEYNKATGMAQLVKALACRSEVTFGRGFDPRLG
ncbi:hypothetical protein ANN_09166 [Periplaneta americana]|uniref:Uncharacterized protein n=1 Tax=Periplaneta americana TaxID=6978 RepID=A0ABQ8TP49_PERAM|nr:hypothetical protein ANN_09166 [Periplaneta americana]